MTIIEGKGTVDGIAIGKISIYEKGEGVIDKCLVEAPSIEVERFHTARAVSKREIEDIIRLALAEAGEAGAALFEAHIQLIDDMDFIDRVETLLNEEKINAEYAVKCTRDYYMDMFGAFEDEYLKSRVSDIADISTRIIKNLQKEKDVDSNKTFTLDEPRIIVAEDLTPSETIQMDKTNILAFVTSKGATSSHSSILARMMGIPAIVGALFDNDINGKSAIVDGYEGIVILEPTEEQILQYTKKKKEEDRRKSFLLKLKGKKNETTDGRSIEIYANIGSIPDAKDAVKNDAGGIGLLRTEFLFFKGDSFPDEEEQYKAYKEIAKVLKGKPVNIRTLDIGADKKMDYFPMAEEQNPAMGYRGIRVSLMEKEIFKTQIRAIYRASVHGDIRILFPFIISVDEILRIKSIMEEVKSELSSESIAYRELKIGAMIETPAAVMISDEISEHVDFLSIGSNDLTQYTLAIDRQNCTLDTFYNPYHKAILKMIKMVVDNGHKNNCKVSICGELAADMSLAEKFIDMGVDVLSVSPPYVLELRNTIRNI